MQKMTVNGVEIAFVDRGCGPVLLLVHGFPFDHSMWDAQIETLGAHCRVIAADLRGFGKSGVWQRDEAAAELAAFEQVVQMRQFADDLVALLDSLEIAEPVFLVGLSMGGYVAFEFVFTYPHRVRGLILCDTKAAGDTPQVAAARRETARRVLQDGPAGLAGSMVPRIFAESTVVERPELIDSFNRVIMRTDRRTLAAASLGMVCRPDVRPMLHNIECPALVIVGEKDVISPPAEMQQIARGIPKCDFVQIVDSGHMSPVERPAEFNAAVLDFLATCLDAP